MWRYGSGLALENWCAGISVVWAIAVFAVLFILRRQIRYNRAKESGICPHCGYDLTGNVSGRCPECGAERD
jgi:hypothetical protein